MWPNCINADLNCKVELVYPTIPSLLLSWALQCALWISNLHQYSLLGRGFYSENACESRAGTLKPLSW